MTKPTQRGRDPKDGRRKLKKDYWAVTITSGEFSMYAWERMDRRGVVHVKFIDPTRTGADRRQKRKLPGDFIVRDDRGRLDDEKVEDVKAIVAQAVARLVLGQEPFAESEPSEAASAVITLRSAFRNALDLQDGKYADKTRRVDEVSRAVRRLERVIGPNTPIVDAVAAPTVKRVWRVLARDYQKSSAPKGRKCGARQTEVTIDALYTVADWLIDEGRLPPGFFKRIRFWRLKLKDDWKQITGEEAETADEDKPRHSEEEMRQLFAVLDDPRRRLFRALRRRLPEGALAGATWSGLTFDDLGMPASLSVNWLRRIRTPRVKKEEWESRPASQRLVLDSRERALVADALRGYLHLLEEARQNGIVSDYPLFPEGDITDGAVAASATKALSLQGASPLTLDERFELAFEIGGEQRMGQVIKSTRRKLTLPGVDRWATERTPRFGVLVPPPARKKETYPIALAQRQHDWVLDVLEHGYLREYEAAFRAGRIQDYPLFIAERMPRGLATWRDAPKPLSRDAALKMFHHLEAIAGVEQLRGRGWYGVRRVAADVVEDVESDERVQDLVLANRKGTRRSHYQEKRRPKQLAKAAEARMKMRAGPARTAAATSSPEALLAALAAAGIALTEEQASALRWVLAVDRASEATESG